MKKGIATIFVFLLLCRAGVYGQQKWGHINSNDIVQAMPEFKQMTEAVDKKKKEAQTQVQQMYDTYQLKAKELNQYGASMMQAIREERAKELDSLKTGIQNYEQNESARIQEFQNKLLKPLNDKYLKMLNVVAKENGYTYIFDLASGSVVYHPESTGDVSELVKKKLGIN
jgi:outer membrane protein